MAGPEATIRGISMHDIIPGTVQYKTTTVAGWLQKIKRRMDNIAKRRVCLLSFAMFASKVYKYVRACTSIYAFVCHIPGTRYDTSKHVINSDDADVVQYIEFTSVYVYFV